MRFPVPVSIRWGATEAKPIVVDPAVGIATLVFKQFLDVKLVSGSQELAIALYALAPPPLPGLSVEWHLGLGSGVTNHEEVFTLPFSDLVAQVPLILHRPARTLQLSAVVTSTITGTTPIKLVAMVGPVAPTWISDVECDVPVKAAESS